MNRLFQTLGITAVVWVVAFGAYLCTTWLHGTYPNLWVLTLAWPGFVALWVGVCRAMRHQWVLNLLTWAGVIR